MSVPMKKPRIDGTAVVSWHGARYLVPIKILDQYKVDDHADALDDSVFIEDVLHDLINEKGEPAMLLKGLRAKEGKTQIEFAKMLNITQQNLSAMENGRRAIGKVIAKRIAKKFGLNYQIFL